MNAFYGANGTAKEEKNWYANKVFLPIASLLFLCICSSSSLGCCCYFLCTVCYCWKKAESSRNERGAKESASLPFRGEGGEGGWLWTVGHLRASCWALKSIYFVCKCILCPWKLDEKHFGPIEVIQNNRTKIKQNNDDEHRHTKERERERQEIEKDKKRKNDEMAENRHRTQIEEASTSLETEMMVG